MALLRRSSADGISTSAPSCLTPIRLHRCATTVRLWLTMVVVRLRACRRSTSLFSTSACTETPSASRPVPDYQAALASGIKGMRIGVLRHLYEEDVLTTSAVKTVMEAAFDVLRGLGAILEDARIRPASDYHAVKITGAESELYAVHEPVQRTRLGDFGEDFLSRALGALLIGGMDYVQSSRQRRVMIAEMEPLYACHDVLLTMGPGPAARLDAWRLINFWRRDSVTTPFNVTGGPALVQCIGFTEDGLPMSMQVVGRPFDDAKVMQVAHAYESATPWRSRRPAIDVHAPFSTALPPVPDPEKAEIG